MTVIMVVFTFILTNHTEYLPCTCHFIIGICIAGCSMPSSISFNYNFGKCPLRKILCSEKYFKFFKSGSCPSSFHASSVTFSIRKNSMFHAKLKS